MTILGSLVIFECFLKILAVSVSNSSDTSIRNPFEIGKFFEVYSSEKLANSLKNVDGYISSTCYEDLISYVNALQNGEKWALQMDDASGRYSTGWFWGNHYWHGSRDLCEYISLLDQNHEVDGESMQTPHIRPLQKTEISLNRANLSTNSSQSPYPVLYFTINMKLNRSFLFAETEKKIELGVCLPQSCQNEDVKKIIEETSSNCEYLKLEVSEIKSKHNYYNMFEDRTFQILCSVTTIIVIFVLLGTGLDYYLERKEQIIDTNSIKCATHKNSDFHFSKATANLNISDIEVKDGKDYCYNMENTSLERDKKNCNGSKPKSSENPSDSYACLKEILLSFSLKSNIKIIFDENVGIDTIPVIHGLKVISMIWVIGGHTCIYSFEYTNNMKYRKVIEKQLFFQMIANATFSVDIFFFCSGFLVSYLYFRTTNKLEAMGHKGFSAEYKNFSVMIIYRLLRLTAPYVAVLGLVEISMKWFAYNAVLTPSSRDHINCPKYWWRNLFYINALFPYKDMCMLWSWYLSNDTIFYVISAILLVIASRHLKIATFSLLFLSLSSWILTAYISITNNHIPNIEKPLSHFDEIYSKPWTRFTPYIIGIIVGWVLFKTSSSIKISLLGNIVGWLTSSACLLLLICGLYETKLSIIAGAAYSSLSHSAWALSIGWVVVACATGNGGFINSILSARILYPISRITYCAYLVHPLVLQVMLMHMESPLSLGKLLMFTIFLGQVVLSYFCALIISLIYEAPVVSLLRIVRQFLFAQPERKTTM